MVTERETPSNLEDPVMMAVRLAGEPPRGACGDRLSNRLEGAIRADRKAIAAFVDFVGADAERTVLAAAPHAIRVANIVRAALDIVATAVRGGSSEPTPGPVAGPPLRYVTTWELGPWRDIGPRWERTWNRGGFLTVATTVYETRDGAGETIWRWTASTPTREDAKDLEATAESARAAADAWLAARCAEARGA